TTLFRSPYPSAGNHFTIDGVRGYHANLKTHILSDLVQDLGISFGFVPEGEVKPAHHMVSLYLVPKIHTGKFSGAKLRHLSGKMYGPKIVYPHVLKQSLLFFHRRQQALVVPAGLDQTLGMRVKPYHHDRQPGAGLDLEGSLKKLPVSE